MLRRRQGDAADRLAAGLINYRILFLIVMGLVTGFFAFGLRDLQISTIFSDLLPSDHQYVQTFKDHPNFGSPLSVQMMIKRKDGDIYHADTLAKVWDMTWEVGRIAGVDHDQLISIATEKARIAVATPFGIESQPLMGDHPPANANEVKEFSMLVKRGSGIVPFLVSTDHSATVIRATFIEDGLNFREVFDQLRHLLASNRDAQHDIYIAGYPMLIGWVYLYEREMVWIFSLTLGAMFLALLLYTRNLAGTITPLVVSLVSAVWGFGLVGWIGYNIEPLVMVVPLLLIARSFSHCVQVTERYYEFLHAGRTKRGAATDALRALLVPGALGIATDAAALLLIGVAPIPMMQKFALFCGFWALSLLPANVFLSPVILSLLPTPKNVQIILSKVESSALHYRTSQLLTQIASLSHGSRSRVTVAALLIATLIGGFSASQLSIGSEQEGSALLWEDSEYNRAVRAFNRHFPGMNTLELIFEGYAASAMRKSEAIHTMHSVQRHIESQRNPPAVTLSFADYLPEINRLFSGGNPKWLPLDRDESRIRGAVNGVLFGTNTENFSHVTDLQLRHATVTVWLKDLKAVTIEQTLEQARRAIAEVGETHEQFRIRLGSGTAALQQAVNERIATYEGVVMILLLVVIFVTCSLAYHSTVAGIILLVPVTMASLLLSACMVALGISLDVNTMPVTAIGIGIGIDYGIYLLSRLREESSNTQDVGVVIQKAVTTTGKAIFFTATVVLIGLLPWYMSNLRFQADMGLLLALVMVINMAIALIVVPLLTYLLAKPRFMRVES